MYYSTMFPKLRTYGGLYASPLHVEKMYIIHEKIGENNVHIHTKYYYFVYTHYKMVVPHNFSKTLYN